MKCDIQGEILGVSDVKSSSCCIKCEKPIKDESSSVIVVCSNTKCNLKQKATHCIKKRSLKAFVSSKEESTTLIFDHDRIVQAFRLNDAAKDWRDLMESKIEEYFLSLPNLQFSYQKSSKEVTNICKLIQNDDDIDDELLLGLQF